VDDCLADTGGSESSYEEWLDQADALGEGAFNDGIREFINEARSISFDPSEIDLNVNDVGDIVRQLQSIAASATESDLRATTQSLLAVLPASDDEVVGSAIESLRRLLLNIVLYVLLVPVAIVVTPILGVLVSILAAVVILAVGFLVLIFLILVVAGGGLRGAQQYDVGGDICRTELLECEYNRFLSKVVPSLMEVAYFLADGEGDSSAPAASP